MIFSTSLCCGEARNNPCDAELALRILYTFPGGGIERPILDAGRVGHQAGFEFRSRRQRLDWLFYSLGWEGGGMSVFSITSGAEAVRVGVTVAVLGRKPSAYANPVSTAIPTTSNPPIPAPIPISLIGLAGCVGGLVFGLLAEWSRISVGGLAGAATEGVNWVAAVGCSFVLEYSRLTLKVCSVLCFSPSACLNSRAL